MKITVLLENMKSSPGLITAHGLSLYVRTKNKKILIDTGPKDYYYQNANKLDIDISQVDCLFITHGHFDHGGGLFHFLSVNSKAKVYIQRSAFRKHYAKLLKYFKFNIGLNNKLTNDRIILLDGDYEISDFLKVYVNEKTFMPKPSQNRKLYELMDNVLIHDDFSHEQYILITEERRFKNHTETYSVLFTGCSHNGIANIINDINSFHEVTHVVGGFHLKKEKAEILIRTKAELNKLNMKIYTMHCTSYENYLFIKNENIKYVKTGEEISI